MELNEIELWKKEPTFTIFSLHKLLNYPIDIVVLSIKLGNACQMLTYLAQFPTLVECYYYDNCGNNDPARWVILNR